jgi:osmotically inducible lipoprotein OsmB
MFAHRGDHGRLCPCARGVPLGGGASLACRLQSPGLVPPARPTCTCPLAVLGHGPVSLPPDQSHALLGRLLLLARPVREHRCEAAAPPLEAKTTQARETRRRELAHLCTRVSSVRHWLARVILPATAAAAVLRKRAGRISPLRHACASPATVLGVRHTVAPLRSRISRKLVGRECCTPSGGMALARYAWREVLDTKGEHMPQRFAVIAVLVLLVGTGCANMTPRQQRALSGGAIGAAGGAAVGAIVGGSPAVGAAVGGAVGAATGALIK